MFIEKDYNSPLQEQDILCAIRIIQIWRPVATMF